MAEREKAAPKNTPGEQKIQINAEEAAAEAVRTKQWWSPAGIIHTTSSKAAGILSRSEMMSVRRRLALIALGVVVFAALLASIGNYIFLSHSPEEAVEDYMGNLQSGNYFMTVDRSAYSDVSAVFLKNSMYRAASGRVDSYEILSVNQKKDSAVARVKITVGTNTRTVEIPLKQNHKSGLFNDTWQLDYSPQVNQTVSFGLPLQSVEVNGYELKLKESSATVQGQDYSWNIPLLPGRYVFDLPDNSYYSLVGGQKKVGIDLLQNESAVVNFTLRPSARMWNETDSAINSWLKRCESSRSLAPTGCPTSEVYDNSGRRLSATGSTASESGSVALETDSATASASAIASESPAGPVNITDVEWELVERPALVLVQNDADHRLWQADRSTAAVFNLSYKANGVEETETVLAYIDADVTSDGNTASIAVGLGEKTG